MSDDPEARKLARAGWSVRKLTLAEAVDNEAVAADAALAMMWELALQAYAFAGVPDVETPRHLWPSSLRRLVDASS